MIHCKRCNRFVTRTCTSCLDDSLRQATRLPLRIEAPQAHPRCHRCWNLSPVCRCDGTVVMPDPLPGLLAGR